MSSRKRNRRIPLPPRDGLGASRVRVPEGMEIAAGDYLWEVISSQRYRHPEDNRSAVADRFAAEEVVLIDGTPLTPSTLLRPGTDVYFYRRPAPEERVPYEIEPVFEDDAIMVVKKPPFLSTMPRAAHITENATVRLRRETGNEELAPAHRLDRMTTGLLLFTKRAGLRGAYQQLFAERKVHKLYEAVAPDVGVVAPATWEHHIVKEHGEVTARIIEDAEPNSLTYLRDVNPVDASVTGSEGYARYILEPVTGRTHQLRIQMQAAGAPIYGDPFYPEVKAFGDENYDEPMMLAAVALAFTDPLSGEERTFTAHGFSGLPIPKIV